MLITVLMFLFQTSFHSYFFDKFDIKIWDSPDWFKFGTGVHCYMLHVCVYVYAYIYIHIYIYIYIYIWKHFQTPCIVHHTLLYIILQELNVFDNDLRRKYNELECKIFQIYLKVRSNKIRNYWDLIALVWN